MRAILTSDLFKEGSEKLVVKTCASMLGYMSDIYAFMDNFGLYFKLTANHSQATLTVYGDELLENIPRIKDFIYRHGWSDKYSE